jgi:hydroxyacylglutathione hydrolase
VRTRFRNRRFNVHMQTILLVCCAAAAFAPASAQVATSADDDASHRAADAPVIAATFGFTTTYLIRGERWVLIDTPDRRDCAEFFDWLTRTLPAREMLSAVVVTHAHADHVGCARTLQQEWKVAIVVGAGDVQTLAQGRNPTIRPVKLSGHLLRPWVRDDTFEPLAPDIALAEEIRLEGFGVAGRAYPAGGHTPGSLIVLLDSGEAFVGDLLLGGAFGGKWMPTRPSRHYFADDPCAVGDALARLLERSPHTLHPGHGGPLRAEDVARLLERRARDVRACG